MKYKFEIDGKVREFWYNDIKRTNGVEGTMEEILPGQVSSEDNPSIYIDCHRDENKDLYFITSDGYKVMCKDAITLTPSEFLTLAYSTDLKDKNIHIMDEMMRTMQKYGIGCIRFRMNDNPLEYISFKANERGYGEKLFRTPCRKNDWSPEWVEYEAHPEFNRMPETNHKLRLYAVHNPEEHGTHDFYTMDLNSMWIERPDYMQLTLGVEGTPNGIYGKMSDSEYLETLR